MSEGTADQEETTSPIPPWGTGVHSSMSCDEAVHGLYGYLDGELTEERRAEIGRHLDGCAPCGSAAHFEAELRAVIADRCRDTVPESLKERVAAVLSQEKIR